MKHYHLFYATLILAFIITPSHGTNIQEKFIQFNEKVFEGVLEIAEKIHSVLLMYEPIVKANTSPWIFNIIKYAFWNSFSETLIKIGIVEVFFTGRVTLYAFTRF